MDKVAKTQSAQREGFAMQQAIQGVEHQRKTEEHIQSVNEAQDMGEGSQKVKDRGAREQEAKKKKEEQSRQKNDSGGNSENEKTENSIFRHPLMGRNIDISL